MRLAKVGKMTRAIAFCGDPLPGKSVGENVNLWKRCGEQFA